MNDDWREPFEPDEHTVALYHFNEGEGDEAHDACGDPELTLRAYREGLWGSRPGFGATARFDRQNAHLLVGPANNDKLELRTCTREWTIEAWVRYTGPGGKDRARNWPPRTGIHVRQHLRLRRGRMRFGGRLPPGLDLLPANGRDGSELDAFGRAPARGPIPRCPQGQRSEQRRGHRVLARDRARLAAGRSGPLPRQRLASRGLAVPLPGPDRFPVRRRQDDPEGAAPGSRSRFDSDHGQRRRAVRHPLSGGRLSPSGASGRLGPRGLRHDHVQPGRRDRRVAHLGRHALPGGGQPEHHPPEAARSRPEPALSGPAGHGCGRRKRLLGAGGGQPARGREPGPVRGGDTRHAGADGGGPGADHSGAR